MHYKVIYSPDIYEDIQKSIDWYNEQQTDLGEHFLSTLKGQMISLSTTSKLYNVRYDNIRCMRLNKFPFMIHYYINEAEKTVFVEGVFHTSLNPKRWRK